MPPHARSMDQPPPQYNNGMPVNMAANQGHWGAPPQMQQMPMQQQQQGRGGYSDYGQSQNAGLVVSPCVYH